LLSCPLFEDGIDGKGKAACIGGVVESGCEESSGVREESVVGHSGGEEIASVTRRCDPEGDEIGNSVSVDQAEGG
jgi:hypothetical protein